MLNDFIESPLFFFYRHFCYHLNTVFVWKETETKRKKEIQKEEKCKQLFYVSHCICFLTSPLLTILLYCLVINLWHFFWVSIVRSCLPQLYNHLLVAISCWHNSFLWFREIDDRFAVLGRSSVTWHDFLSPVTIYKIIIDYYSYINFKYK